MSKIQVGDEVIVPEPIEGDIHSHEFVGIVTDIRGDLAVVEDQDSDFYEIELDRLRRVRACRKRPIHLLCTQGVARVV